TTPAAAAATATATRTRCLRPGVRMRGRRLRLAMAALAMPGLAGGARRTLVAMGAGTLAARPLPGRTLATTALRRDGRVQADRTARLEAGHDVHAEFGLEHVLDLAQQAALFRRHQRQRFAGHAGTAGAADAVDVV